MIIWLTANSGAGKTLVAKAAQKKFPNIIVLDGDEMRNTICKGLGFSKEDRTENNLRIARLANLLQSQGFAVIVSVIAPYEELRQKVTEICHPFWIYVRRNLPERKDYPYEVPKNPDYVIDNTGASKEDAINQFIGFLEKEEYPDKRFIPPHGNA